MKYRIETTNNKDYKNWNLFGEYENWDLAYKSWEIQHKVKSYEEYEGFCNIRMIREDGRQIENCLLYDAWIERNRKEFLKRELIITNLEFLLRKIYLMKLEPEETKIFEDRFLQIIQNIEKPKEEKDY